MGLIYWGGEAVGIGNGIGGSEEALNILHPSGRWTSLGGETEREMRRCQLFHG